MLMWIVPQDCTAVCVLQLGMCPQLVFAARPHLCLHFPRFELPLTLTQENRGVNA